MKIILFDESKTREYRAVNKISLLFECDKFSFAVYMCVYFYVRPCDIPVWFQFAVYYLFIYFIYDRRNAFAGILAIEVSLFKQYFSVLR